MSLLRLLRGDTESGNEGGRGASTRQVEPAASRLLDAAIERGRELRPELVRRVVVHRRLPPRGPG